jgi:hypothetical protein
MRNKSVELKKVENNSNLTSPEVQISIELEKW